MRDAIEVQMPNVYRFALRLTRGDVHAAEELAQETLLRGLKKSTTLQEPSTLRVWLFRIASNCWVDQIRIESRQRAALAQAIRLVRTEMPAADEHIEAVEELQISLAELDKLPERQRSVLYLTACEQLDAAEVAEVLQISTGAVKANLCVARARMRRTMLLRQNSNK